MCELDIPAVEIKDYPVGFRFIAQDGVILSVVATYDDPDYRLRTLTLSDGEESRTFGLAQWCTYVQHMNVAKEEVDGESSWCQMQ